jgi:hypothetical protein
MDMATACAIHYSLHPGIVIRYLKGKYISGNRNVTQILQDVLSHVNETDASHIKGILTQGFPSRNSFEGTSAMKALIIMKGNQATFKMQPEIITKTMNKEDKNSHLLPVKFWVVCFSPYC